MNTTWSHIFAGIPTTRCASDAKARARTRVSIKKGTL